ncbi:MAG TPA: glycosyltransferase family 39 protein [Acidimicrobiales bacterium]|nr:glycosyltransferase family 39 protein [Acidimicrobiales bacterium]
MPQVRERRSWPLPLAAPELAATALLLFAVRHFDGASLVRTVMFGGTAMVVRRAATSAWVSRDLSGPGLIVARSRARNAAVVVALGFLAGAAALAAAGAATADTLGVALIGLASVPAILAALEHQAGRTCARRGRLAGGGAAGGAALLATGIGVVSLAPDGGGTAGVLAPLVALTLGDVIGLVVAWHRSHSGPCHPIDQQPSSSPLPARPRPVAVAVATTAIIGAMHLLVLAGGLDWLSPSGGGADRGDLTLLAGLAVLGLLPYLAAGVVPALVIPGLTAGRRDAVVPALLLGAVLSSGAILLVMAAPNRLLRLGDPRLGPLAAYFAVAMALLGLAQLLIHHRVAGGGARTALVVGMLALGLQVALAAGGTGPAVEVAVDAALGGAAVLLVGLVVATAAASPFAFAIPVHEAGGGPRLVGPVLVGLTTAGLAVRLVSFRPLWLNEAATARLVDGSFTSMFSGGLSGDAHPPLHLALAWMSQRAFGDSVLALRLPSLVAGTLLVPLLYLAGKQMYGRRTALVAAAVGALAPPLVWFSTEAGVSAISALMAVASVLAAHRALRRGRVSDWVLLGLAEAALLWSHQLAFVHLAVLNVAVAIAVWRRYRSGCPKLALTGGVAIALAVLAAAAIPLVMARSGIGPPRMLPPLEYATSAAPSSGSSVFPILGTGVSALLGFHPTNVMSRLLALWPLGILAALLVLGRARSPRTAVLVSLAIAPFAALFAAQLLGVPRVPAFALSWAATAVPMLALLMGRAMTVLGGRWRRSRVLAVGLGVLLLGALADQALRVEPSRRFAVGPVVESVADKAGRGDLIAYEPAALGDLVRYRAKLVDTRPVAALDGPEAAPTLASHERVHVVAAFALGAGDTGVERTVALVKQLSATRPLLEERGAEGAETKVWVFGPERAGTPPTEGRTP